MKLIFKHSFLKDVRKINDKSLKKRVAVVIRNVESANSLEEIQNISKLKGFNDFYRIRIGNFRIGLMKNNTTIYFVALANRKDIYKRFPLF